MDSRLKIPFRINRNVRINLPEQVADGFRQAIRSGYYKPGDVLPPRGEIAKALGISMRIPREAIRILAAENLVCARRGVGCSVLAQKDRLWKGRVLIVERDMCAGSYYAAMVVNELRRKLLEAGYLYTNVCADMKYDGRSFNLVPVAEALRQPTDFVFAVYPTMNLVRFLRRRVPFMCNGDDIEAEELVPMDWMPAREHLIQDCRRKGVHRILVARFGDSDGELDMFRSAGFEVEDLTVWPNNRFDYLAATEQGALEAVRERFAPGKPRPDLVYFADDYVARGGLMALMSLGVKVPNEMKVVSLTNHGFEPSFPIPLARIEYDPVVNGAFVAKCVISRLEGLPQPEPIADSRYIPGDSFPM